MRITVKGKHLDVGDALTEHVSERLAEVVAKYAERPTEAIITFSKDRHEFVADTSVHLSTGMTAQAKARGGEIYGAFDGAADRLEKQLRRYKRRLKDHHRDRIAPVEFADAPSYILAADEGSDGDEPESLQPMIVAEMETRIPSISVGEAVMQMELGHSDVLVFRNERHGRINVVHRREDGNIGWIDPE